MSDLGYSNKALLNPAYVLQTRDGRRDERDDNFTNQRANAEYTSMRGDRAGMAWEGDYDRALAARAQSQQGIRQWQAGRQPFYDSVDSHTRELGRPIIADEMHDSERQNALAMAQQGTRHGSLDMARRGGISQAGQQKLGALSLQARQRADSMGDYDRELAHKMMLQSYDVGNPLSYGTAEDEIGLSQMGARHDTGWLENFYNTRQDARDSIGEQRSQQQGRNMQRFGAGVKSLAGSAGAGKFSGAPSPVSGAGGGWEDHAGQVGFRGGN
jgi:hypothetical protein